MDLTQGQRDDVRNFLLSRGLAFKPLLDEMTDHISCDLQEQMNRGMSYEDAWAQTINALPEDHFILIQQDTMETINRRFNLSRVFTYVGMGAIIIATIFKVLHLSGADELLLLSILNLGASLLTASVSGIYFNRDKKGSIRVAGVVAGTILLMIGYTFKILHMRGADQLIIIGVAISVLFMIANTVHAYNSTSSNSNLFTFLHEKYSPGIERFLLILTVPVVLGALFMMNSFPVIHILIIYASALQFIALAWRSMEQNNSHKNQINLILVISAFVCFNIPMLGPLVPIGYRLIMIIAFNIVATMICVRMEPKKIGLSLVLFVPPVVFILLALDRLNWLSTFSAHFSITIVAALILIIGIFGSERNSISRTYMILSLAGLMLEASTL